jgi:hypothetical protein
MTMPAAPLTTADGDEPGHMTLGHWRHDLAPSVRQPAETCSELVPRGDFDRSKPLQLFSSISPRLRERSGSRKVQPASSTLEKSGARTPSERRVEARTNQNLRSGSCGGLAGGEDQLSHLLLQIQRGHIIASERRFDRPPPR